MTGSSGDSARVRTLADDVVIEEVLLAGLPKAGKTSYLALLYTAIVQERTSDLLLGSYQDDREYLNRVSKRLLECNEAVHTEVAEQGQLSLSMLIGSSRIPARLRIPDLSGETWEQALHDRTWPESLEQAVRQAIGVLLFVHVTEFDAGASIVSVRQAEAALGQDENDVGTASIEDESTRPTQVQVVDLLQLLCEQRARRPARVSVILSAWDLTKSSSTPSKWIESNTPLVDQYLSVNRPWLEAAIWGVSAQGGSFRDPKSRAKLLARDAIDRANVVDSAGAKQSVEAPVSWALGIRE